MLYQWQMQGGDVVNRARRRRRLLLLVVAAALFAICPWLLPRSYCFLIDTGVVKIGKEGKLSSQIERRENGKGGIDKDERFQEGPPSKATRRPAAGP